MCTGGEGTTHLSFARRAGLTSRFFFEQLIDADFDMSVLLGAVLEESGYAESRASKMDVDDFLK